MEWQVECMVSNERFSSRQLKQNLGVFLFKSHSFCWIKHVTKKPLTVHPGSHGFNLHKAGPWAYRAAEASRSRTLEGLTFGWLGCACVHGHSAMNCYLNCASMHHISYVYFFVEIIGFHRKNFTCMTMFQKLFACNHTCNCNEFLKS